MSAACFIGFFVAGYLHFAFWGTYDMHEADPQPCNSSTTGIEEGPT